MKLTYLYHKDTENPVSDSLSLKKVKVKESHNRPGVAQKVPEGLGSQISMTFVT
jgi:hypothetical protein